MHVYPPIHTESIRIHVCCVHINHMVVFFCLGYLDDVLFWIRSIKVKMPKMPDPLANMHCVYHTHIIRYPQPGVYVQSKWIKQFCWGTSLLVTCLLVKKTASWPQLAHILSYISKIRQVTPTWIVDVGLTNGWRKCCFLKWNELHLLDKDRTKIRCNAIEQNHAYIQYTDLQMIWGSQFANCQGYQLPLPSHRELLFFSRNLGNDDAICWAPHATFLHFALEAFKPSRVGARKCCFGESWTALICREYWMAGAAGGGYDVRKLSISLWKLEKVKGHVVLTSKSKDFQRSSGRTIWVCFQWLSYVRHTKSEAHPVSSQRGILLTWSYIYIYRY